MPSYCKLAKRRTRVCKHDEQRSISPSCTRYAHAMIGKLATDPGMLDPAIASSMPVHPTFSLIGQHKTDPTAYVRTYASGPSLTYASGYKTILLTYVHVLISIELEVSSVLSPKGESDRSLSGPGLETLKRFTLH